ncbi:NYN domain-containing protein [Burkholderia glumae]|uniref:NYN domain-containing protein n=1 Tax=Burkholderia glumae TaxID=337 RepID=UPI002150EC95|nr:NYN domain-containing protein [Burkholderia glumae]UVS98747.1 NYN domain-containing protein [Burkholderia glumae]
MALPQDSVNMALFCDFENIALGVRDTKFEKFDIKPVLEKLLLKGSIVVKKAYCDWDRYKTFKGAMHEASFELIEIPHVRQSGKNSADIRLVVDALDLCYTKSHVDTFVIISGDSDFSPLVSKLRENAKRVIGVGVKNSTSDLLVANCDEFIFYDDLAREQQRALAKRDARTAAAASGKRADDERQRKQDGDARKLEAITIAVETFDALASERSDSGKIWASVLKSAIKRRKPGFNESYYGFRAFGNLLEEAQARGLLEIGRDEKSGTYVSRGGVAVEPVLTGELAKAAEEGVTADAPAEPARASRHGEGRHGGTRRRDRAAARGGDDARPADQAGKPEEAAEPADAIDAVDAVDAIEAAAPAQAEAPATAKPHRDGRQPRHADERRHAKRDDARHGKGRGSRKPEQMPLIDDTPAAADTAAPARAAEPEESAPIAAPEAAQWEVVDAEAESAARPAAKSAKARKTPARTRKAAARKAGAAAADDAAHEAAPASAPAGDAPAGLLPADDAPAPAAAKRARSPRSGAARARRPRGTAGSADES